MFILIVQKVRLILRGLNFMHLFILPFVKRLQLVYSQQNTGIKARKHSFRCECSNKVKTASIYWQNI